MIKTEEFGIPKNFFELLAMLPWEPDERLMDIEARLMAGEFDDNLSISLNGRAFKGTKKQMKFLCDQKLRWREIAEYFDETVDRCKFFARAHGIEKVSCVGRPKITDPQKKAEFRIAYYERYAPTVEQLDRLMILYGGFIGLLAFKLNRPYHVARNMLKYRGKYYEWLRYNFYLGKGGKPKQLPKVEKS